MAQVVTADERTVVERAQAGDRQAFGELYDAYLTPIYDFTYRMLRNRADAEDVTSEVFLKAVERLDSLKDPAAFKGWLYSIARNAALSLIESRKKATPVAEHFESAQPAEVTMLTDPEARAETADLQGLVWEAADALNPRDRSVFELNVRHGLGSKEIAQALDVRPAYAYILVNRLKGSVSESLDAVLLVKAGECPDLEEVVASYPDEVSPRMRKAVIRHAKRCEVCGDTRKRRGAVGLLQGTAWAQPAPAFAATLSGRIDEHWSAHGPVSGSGASGSAGSGGTSNMAHLAAIGAIVGVVVGASVLFAAQQTIAPEDVEPASAETSLPPVASTPAPETPAPAAPAAPAAPSTPAPREPDVQIIINEGGEGVEVTEGETSTSDDDRPVFSEPPRETEDPQMEPPQREPAQTDPPTRTEDPQQTYPPIG